MNVEDKMAKLKSYSVSFKQQLSRIKELLNHLKTQPYDPMREGTILLLEDQKNNLESDLKSIETYIENYERRRQDNT